MKKLKQLLIFFALLFPLLTSAQNCLTIHQKDGKSFSYLFQEKPVIKYSDSDLVLTTTKVQVVFPIRSLAKFTFDDVDTSISTVEKLDASYKYSENVVWIKGTESQSVVLVYTIDGKMVETFITDENGDLVFSVDEFAEGVYIVRTESVTFKILKK